MSEIKENVAAVKTDYETKEYKMIVDLAFKCEVEKRQIQKMKSDVESIDKTIKKMQKDKRNLDSKINKLSENQTMYNVIKKNNPSIINQIKDDLKTKTDKYLK